MISVMITSRGATVTGVTALSTERNEFSDVPALMDRVVHIVAEQGVGNYYQHASKVRHVTHYEGRLELVADSGAKVVLQDKGISLSLPDFNTTEYPYAI